MQVSNKLESLTLVAEHILNQEADDYVQWCEENELDPKDINGDMQKSHVYALALIGLGLEFEE